MVRTLTPIAEPLVSLLPHTVDEVVRIRSAAFFAQPQLAGLRALVFEASTLERLEINFGFRPEDVEEVIFGKVDEKPLVLVRATRSVRPNAEAIASRMNTVEYASEAPFRRSGFIGAERREVAVLSPRTLLYAAAMPQVAQVIRAARHELAPRNGALPSAGEPCSAGPSGDALLTWCSLQPIEFPVDAPVAMLLARHRSACVSMHLEAAEARFSVVFEGEFPAGADENLRTLGRSLASSELGRVFAAEEALREMEVAHCTGRLEAHVAFQVARLERGLGTVLAPTLREMISVQPAIGR